VLFRSQRVRDGFASRRWGRENLPGIENVSLEEERIQEEAFVAAYMQGMQAKAAQGDMSAAAAWLQAIKKHGGNMIDALWEVIQANPAVMAPAPGQPGPASPGMSAGAEVAALQAGGGAAPASVPGAPGQGPPSLPPLEQLLSSNARSQPRIAGAAAGAGPA